jgi:hypothetical protein
MTMSQAKVSDLEKDQLLTSCNGYSAQEWMDLRIRYDGLGRYDLAEWCSEQAEEAYAADDAEEG